MFGLLKYYAKQDQDPKTNEVILKFDNNEVNRIKGKLKGEKRFVALAGSQRIINLAKIEVIAC